MNALALLFMKRTILFLHYKWVAIPNQGKTYTKTTEILYQFALKRRSRILQTLKGWNNVLL